MGFIGDLVRFQECAGIQRKFAAVCDSANLEDDPLHTPCSSSSFSSSSLPRAAGQCMPQTLRGASTVPHFDIFLLAEGSLAAERHPEFDFCAEAKDLGAMK